MENGYKKFGIWWLSNMTELLQVHRFQTLGDPCSEDHKEYSRYVNDNFQAWKNDYVPASNSEFPSSLTKFPSSMAYFPFVYISLFFHSKSQNFPARSLLLICLFFFQAWQFPDITCSFMYYIVGGKYILIFFRKPWIRPFRGHWFRQWKVSEMLKLLTLSKVC